MTTTTTAFKICPTCRKAFKTVWPDQAECPTCRPLAIDPELKRLTEGLARRIWRGLPG